MNLTRRQKDILDFIRTYRATHGISPTQREIRENFGLSSFGTVQKHLKRLEEKGALSREWNRSRGIAPSAERASSREVALLGFVAAGRPIEPFPDEERIEVPASLLGKGEHFVLRVPANRPVRLMMTSRDVIHSFFVPAFRVKQDVLPGRYTETWFEAIQPGRYQLLCAEYCGTNHSLMLGEVIVLRPDEFDSWLADQRRGRALQQDGAPTADEDVTRQADLVRQGERFAVQYGCVKCHSIDGSPHIGPTWLDLFLRREELEGGQTIIADEAYLTESMMDPRAKIVRGFNPVMPVFKGRLAGPEAAAIVEYIKSLRSEPLEQARSRRPVYEPIRSR